MSSKECGSNLMLCFCKNGGLERQILEKECSRVKQQSPDILTFVYLVWVKLDPTLLIMQLSRVFH